jgi:hypothetical protein
MNVLPGAGGVTPTGEYTYRIPIQVPAGRAGMQPSLALVYSSRGGNGMLGVGWHLEGLSEIDPCPKTIATEGLSDGVHFDQSGAFCLDGQKLIPIGLFTSPIDKCRGTEYRTEEDTFARIGSCISEDRVARFTVWLKDGRIRTYTPYETKYMQYNWLLADERDRAGNSIHIWYDLNYDENDWTIEYYPAQIDYTFQENSTPAEAARRRVRFDYDDTRRDPEIREVLAESGTAIFSPTTISTRVRKLLTGISVFVPSESPDPVWRYEISYQKSPGTGRSLLDSVRRCGSGIACELRKVFGWESGGEPKYEVRDLDVTTYDKHAFVGDLNGDGRDELVYDLYSNSTGFEGVRALTTKDPSAPLTEKVELSWAYTFTPDFETLNVNVADLDGDGRDEIIVPGGWNGEYLVMSLSDVFPGDPAGSYMSLAGVYAYTNGLFTADIDGDGLPDLVNGAPCQGPTECSSWYYHLNQGAWTFGPAQSTPTGAGVPLEVKDPSYQTGFRRAPLVLDQGWHRASAFPAFSVPNAPNLGWMWGFRLDPNHGPVVTQTPSPPYEATTWAVADLNGDGIGEVVYVDEVDPSSHYVNLCAKGETWSYGCRKFLWRDLALPVPADVPNWGATHGEDKWMIQVADLDADGRGDFIVSYLPQGYPDAITDPEAKPITRVYGFGQQHYDYKEGDDDTKMTLDAPPEAFGDFDGDGKLDYITYDAAAGKLRLHLQRGFRAPTDIVSG